MVYAPGDFSDLHLVPHNVTDRERDMEKYPVIQGFITGFSSSVISVTFEFNVVIEYVPKPILYQMVQRKPAIVDANSLAKAENLAARVDTGVEPGMLDQVKRVSQLESSELRRIGQAINGKQRGGFMNF